MVICIRALAFPKHTRYTLVSLSSRHLDHTILFQTHPVPIGSISAFYLQNVPQLLNFFSHPYIRDVTNSPSDGVKVGVVYVLSYDQNTM